MAHEEQARKRYPTDLTDEQWVILEPMLPRPPNMAARHGELICVPYSTRCCIRIGPGVSGICYRTIAPQKYRL